MGVVGWSVVVASGEGAIGSAMVARGRLVDCVILRKGVVEVA